MSQTLTKYLGFSLALPKVEYLTKIFLPQNIDIFIVDTDRLLPKNYITDMLKVTH
jgi:hypothetical protein